MKLKDLKTVFGIPMEKLDKAYSVWRKWTYILVIVDLVVMCGLTIFMFFFGASATMYWIALVVVCLFMNFLMSALFSKGVYETAIFVHKHKDCEVMTKHYQVTLEALDEVLCGADCAPPDEVSMEVFKTSIFDTCLNSPKNAVVVASELSRYEVPTGNLSCLIMRYIQKQYFVGFPSDTDVV